MLQITKHLLQMCKPYSGKHTYFTNIQTRFYSKKDQVPEKEYKLRYLFVSVKPTYLQYINHSCNPNVFFDTKMMVLSTLEYIKRGEEIAFFYPSTEWKTSNVTN